MKYYSKVKTDTIVGESTKKAILNNIIEFQVGPQTVIIKAKAIYDLKGIIITHLITHVWNTKSVVATGISRYRINWGKIGLVLFFCIQSI